MPTPRTIACERAEDALEAFDELGGDVIVKPLFGSMGAGMTRVDDPDVAYRVFHALALERAVYYLQEALPHAGRDLRAFVVGGRVLAAIERVGAGWRANLARGAQARPTELSAEQERLCLEAAEALGADYAGVDLLRRRTCWSSTASPAGTGCRRRPAPTWRRRSSRTWSRSSAKLGQLVRPDDAAMQRRRDERARRAGVAERAQVLDVAHAAAGEQLEVGEGGMDLGDQPDVRARAAAHPRQVEHDRLAQPRAVQARHGVERRQAGELRVGRQPRPSRRSALRTRRLGKLREQTVERIGAGSVSVPTTTRCTPRSSSARARSGSLTPASTMTRASRASARCGAVLAVAADRVEVGDV